MSEQQVNPWAPTPEEKELVAKSKSNGNINNMKFKEGDTTVRIVGSYFFFEEHWINKIKRTVICPRKQCPVCNHPDKEKLKQAAEPLKVAAETSRDKLGADHKKTKAAWKAYFKTCESDRFEARLRFAVNIIDRAEGAMKIWRFSPTMKGNIEAIAGNFGDPNTYDLIVNRKGLTMLDTEYRILPSPKSEELTETEKALKAYQLSLIFKSTDMAKAQAYADGKIPATVQKAAQQEEAQSTELPDSVAKALDPHDVEELGDLGDIV